MVDAIGNGLGQVLGRGLDSVSRASARLPTERGALDTFTNSQLNDASAFRVETSLTRDAATRAAGLEAVNRGRDLAEAGIRATEDIRARLDDLRALAQRRAEGDDNVALRAADDAEQRRLLAEIRDRIASARVQDRNLIDGSGNGVQVDARNGQFADSPDSRETAQAVTVRSENLRAALSDLEAELNAISSGDADAAARAGEAVTRFANTTSRVEQDLRGDLQRLEATEVELRRPVNEALATTPPIDDPRAAVNTARELAQQLAQQQVSILSLANAGTNSQPAPSRTSPAERPA